MLNCSSKFSDEEACSECKHDDVGEACPEWRYLYPLCSSIMLSIILLGTMGGNVLNTRSTVTRILLGIMRGDMLLPNQLPKDQIRSSVSIVHIFLDKIRD